MKKRDWGGVRQGKLTVIEPAGKDGKYYLWKCRCDCGVEEVRRASTLSYGCKECTECAKESVRQGVTKSNKARTVHGAGVTPNNKPKLYSLWSGIKYRCYNTNHPKYKDYGGRGIKMADVWLNDYPRFAADVGDPPDPKLTLERKNNDGHYEPGNVEWATRRVQGNNRRSNVLVTYKGETKTIADWARALGFPYMMLYLRWSRGLRDEELFAPRMRKPSADPLK